MSWWKRQRLSVTVEWYEIYGVFAPEQQEVRHSVDAMAPDQLVEYERKLFGAVVPSAGVLDADAEVVDAEFDDGEEDS